MLLLEDDSTPHEEMLLIPSQGLPKLGFSETITLRRLTKKFGPYRTPTADLASVLLKTAFSN